VTQTMYDDYLTGERPPNFKSMSGLEYKDVYAKEDVAQEILRHKEFLTLLPHNY